MPSSNDPPHQPDIAWYENACNCKKRPHLKWCTVAWLNDHQPDKSKVPVEIVEAK